MYKLMTLAGAATLSFGGLTTVHASQDSKVAKEEIAFMQDAEMKVVQGSAFKKQIVRAPGKFKGKGPKVKILTFYHSGEKRNVYIPVRIR